jgi:hypothetical protein
MDRCEWKERGGCTGKATNWIEDGKPRLCIRHRAVLYKREEDKSREAMGRAEFKDLRVGDIIRLYWNETRVKYFFAEVSSVDRTIASAYLINTVTTPQPELDTPGYTLLFYEPSNEVRTARKVQLTNRGTVKLGTVSPSMLIDPIPGKKLPRTLTCYWSIWDHIPISHRVFNDTA